MPKRNSTSSIKHHTILEKKQVLTLCFCGTGSNQEDIHNFDKYFSGENINQLYSVILGKEYVNKLIIDGPGSGEKNIDSFWVPYSPYSKWSGRIRGAGIRERIEHIIAVIKNKPQRQDLAFQEKFQHIQDQLKDRSPITHLVCAGWSRGADALIRLANQLASDPETKHIKMTLILLDPVPGLGRTGQNNRELPSNVKYCYLFCAKDERSFGFSAIIPKHNPSMTCFHLFLIPGSHRHLAGSNENHSGQESEVADLRNVGYTIQFFLQMLASYHGTSLDMKNDNIFKLTLSDIAGLFKKIDKDAKEYKQAAQSASYTFSQIWGKSRKITAGKVRMNQCLSSLPAELQIDLSQLLSSVTTASKNRVKEFIDEFDSKFSCSVILDIQELKQSFVKKIKHFIQNERSHYNGSNLKLYRRLLLRAVSEEFKKQYHVQDLSHVGKQFYTSQQLADDVFALFSQNIEMHNQLVRRLFDLKQFKRAGFWPFYIEKNELLSKIDPLKRIIKHFLKMKVDLHPLHQRIKHVGLYSSDFKDKINQYKQKRSNLYHQINALLDLHHCFFQRHQEAKKEKNDFWQRDQKGYSESDRTSLNAKVIEEIHRKSTELTQDLESIERAITQKQQGKASIKRGRNDLLKWNFLCLLEDEYDRIDRDHTSWKRLFSTVQRRTQLKLDSLKRVMEYLSERDVENIGQEIDKMLSDPDISRKRNPLSFFKSTLEKRLRCFKAEIHVHGLDHCVSSCK